MEFFRREWGEFRTSRIQSAHMTFSTVPPQWRNNNFWAPGKHSLHSRITVLIHNSRHFGPPLPFWAPGPPALPGLPTASYATVPAPCLGNQLPVSLRQPRTSLSITDFLRLPPRLSPSITHSLLHFLPAAYSPHKSFPSQTDVFLPQD